MHACAQGAKGPCLKVNPQATEHFKEMLKDLKKHDEKLTRKDFFYWIFNDSATVGRKKVTRRIPKGDV